MCDVLFHKELHAHGLNHLIYSFLPKLLMHTISFTILYRIAKILSLKNARLIDPNDALLFSTVCAIKWFQTLIISVLIFSPLTSSTYYLSVMWATFCHQLFNVKHFMSRAILCCQVSSCHSNTWQESHDTWNRRAPLHRDSDIPFHWKDRDEPDCWCVCLPFLVNLI